MSGNTETSKWQYLLLLLAVTMIMKVPEKIGVLENERERLRVRIREAGRAAAAAAEEDDRRNRMERVKKLTRIEFRIEDVIDEWNSCLQQESVSGMKNIQAVDDGQHRDHGCVALPCGIDNIVHTRCCDRLQIAYKIWDIESEIKGINERDGNENNFSSEQQDRSSSTRNPDIAWKNLQRNPYRGQTIVVGFEAPMSKMIHWLEDKRPECTVMVLVGMAGQGKTTLANQIFNNSEVIGKFQCSAWINVSDFDTLKEFFGFMLRKFYQQTGQGLPYGFSKMGLESLKNEVNKYLRKKRYVLFFDDVWNKKFWQEIEHTVSNNGNGSRIIITTRNKEVAKTCEESTIVDVESLTDKQSLKLFCWTAFRIDSDQEPCPKKYEKLSCDIYERFKGLALGIVAIGKHVSGARTDEFNWKSKIEDAGIPEILCLSYDNLPRHLQPCLLYFGIYPQNYAVKSKRIIRQWIAEGFINYKTGKTFEEFAEEYLTSLIDRNLVQVSSFTIDGKPRICCVHYLVHDLIHRKFEDLFFCRCFNEDHWSDTSGKTRRLSIATNSTQDLHGFFNNLLVDGTDSSFIRSLHFSTKQKLPEHFVSRITAKDRPLKVLDFENSRLSCGLENLGNLIHLKYLSFRNTKIRSLPKSIGKLQNLETLDVRETAVNEIPEEVSKLRKLQRLLGGEMSLIQLKNGIRDMTSLQTLRGVKLEDEVGLIEKELGKLWRIKDLGLTNVGEEHESALCLAINKMIRLEKLRIDAKSVNDLQDLKKPSLLQKLRLHGKLNKLPEWVPGLDRLVKLVLSGSELTDNPSNSLKGIPKLLFLSIIKEAYEGESLPFEDGDFEELQELELGSLHRLSSITVHSKALPSLKKLQLSDIPQLKTVPSGMQHLKKLQDLNIKNMQTEFEESISPDGVHKHQIIKHVPNVRINGKLLKD